MARETKEQRKEREAHEALERELERQQFVKTLPKRLFEAQALAQSMGIDVEVSLSENGPVLRFDPRDTQKGHWLGETYSYLSEQWEVENLEETLRKIKAEVDAREARKQIALKIFEKLTPEEKIAVKENIYWV